MTNPVAPFSVFNYLVTLTSSGGPPAFGGFFVVSGLPAVASVANFRGNGGGLSVIKIPGIHTVNDVTLKRGIVNSSEFGAWIAAARGTASARRTAVITLRDETGQPTLTWKLRSAVPLKYTGPTLAGRGGGDVAIEELTLTAEDIELSPAK